MHFSANESMYHLDVPRTVPKADFRLAPAMKNRNRALLVRYENGMEFVHAHLMVLQQEILNTTSEYVYPTVYTNFARQYVVESEFRRIWFANEALAELRSLSNDLRDMASELKDDALEYLVYVIACRIIDHANRTI